MNHNKYHQPGMRRKRVERAFRQKKAAQIGENVIVILWFIALSAAVISALPL